MIRKQIYIDDSHQETIRRRAAARGVSEAEVIRQAIDAEGRTKSKDFPLDASAWNRALKLMRATKASGRSVGASVKRHWKRDEIYNDRLSRHDRRTR